MLNIEILLKFCKYSHKTRLLVMFGKKKYAYEKIPKAR
jgi:hypothetical protein